MLIAPLDVVGDQSGLCVVVGVVGAGEAEVAEAFELRLDPVEPGGVVGCVGELDVVVGGPGAHLVAFVDGEVVEHEREPDVGAVAAADLVAEGEELDPCLAFAELAAEQVVADVERAEQVADAVRTGVGGADPPRLRAPRPRLTARLRLEVERGRTRPGRRPHQGPAGAVSRSRRRSRTAPGSGSSSPRSRGRWSVSTTSGLES